MLSWAERTDRADRYAWNKSQAVEGCSDLQQERARDSPQPSTVRVIDLDSANPSSPFGIRKEAAIEYKIQNAAQST